MTTVQQRQELIKQLKTRLSATDTSQEKLGHMLGKTGQTIHRILNGYVDPSYDTMYNIDKKITEIEQDIESQKNLKKLVTSSNERLAHIDRIRKN